MKETTEQRVKQAYKKLQEYLKNIETNEEYLRFLRFQSRFTQYSANNALLIMLSQPDATFVAGYSAWSKMRRCVRKGEKAIRILAPCTFKVYDDTQNDYVDRIAGFRIANVFDISQTEGDDSEIPEIVKGLTDDGQLNEIIFEQLVNACPTHVSFNPSMSAKGSFNCETKQILILNKCSLNQQAKTLFHEWAHFLCDKMKIQNDYATEECIAESVSFVVSERLGMNTSNYSVPYIASWKKDIDVMQSITETVQKLSREILTRLEALGVINLNGLDSFREEDKYHD